MGSVGNWNVFFYLFWNESNFRSLVIKSKKMNEFNMDEHDPNENWKRFRNDLICVIVLGIIILGIYIKTC